MGTGKKIHGVGVVMWTIYFTLSLSTLDKFSGTWYFVAIRIIIRVKPDQGTCSQIQISQIQDADYNPDDRFAKTGIVVPMLL